MNLITNELIGQYEKYLTDEEKAKSTIEKYLHDIFDFKNWLGGRNVEKSAVMEYKNELMEKYAPSSVNSKISSLNNFFVFNEWFKCRIKAIKIQKQIFAVREKELTKPEYERLLKAAREKAVTGFIILCKQFAQPEYAYPMIYNLKGDEQKCLLT